MMMAKTDNAKSHFFKVYVCLSLFLVLETISKEKQIQINPPSRFSGSMSRLFLLLCLPK